MKKDNTTSIIGLLKNELQSIEASIKRHYDEINSLEGMKRRINNIVEDLEAPGGETPPLKISEIINFFIDERAEIDPGLWEDYDLLYNEFENFKREERIKTKVLKSAFFAELAGRGIIKNESTVFYEGEPRHSIRGICLKDNLEAVIEARTGRPDGAEEFWAYQAALQAGRDQEEARKFEEMTGQAEQKEEDKEKKSSGKDPGLFDF